MSNKNEVFEYLIDQLRQQVNKKDATSFNVSVRVSDLDEVKQVIHNLQQHIAGKDDEIRALKYSLRQQVNSSQCEDLAHEVQSLKNQLRDMSAQIKELTCALDCAENEVMCLRSIVDLDPKGAIGYIRRANSAMTDTMRRQYLSKALEELGCKDAPEQSGCRKEDTQEWPYRFYYVVTDGSEQSGCRKVDVQECSHNWRFVNGKAPAVCINCGVTKSNECEHDWCFYNGGALKMCRICGLKK